MYFKDGWPTVVADHVPFDQYDVFTIEAWIKDWSGSIFDQGVSPVKDTWFKFYGSESGWRCDPQRQRASLPHIAGGKFWRHVAFTYDGVKYHSFIDGRLQERGAGPRVPAWREKAKLRLGSIIRDLRINDGLMRSFQISSSVRYPGDSFEPPERLSAGDDTVLLYDFSKVEGDRVLDQSGNNRHGKLVQGWWLKHDGVYR